MSPHFRPGRLFFVLGSVAFLVLAVLNCGGYRYGIGDQAFYIPAVVQHLNPSFFPRDRALLHVQDRLMAFDDMSAAVMQATGISLPALFLAAYAISLIVMFAAAAAIGRTLYRSVWTIALLAALLT